MMCLAARMEASSSQVSLPAPSSILPAPFWGGVKLLKMLVGALMISVMILVFNLFGDGLRDAFDPKLKN